MKILLLNDYGTPTGGAELLLLRLKEELKQRGHDVRLFSSSAHAKGTTVKSDYQCLGTNNGLRAVLQLANLSAVASLKKILHEFNPDVVHAGIFLTQMSPLIMPLLRDYPSIYHAAWYRSICPTGTKMLPNGQSCLRPAGRACWEEGCVPAWNWAPLMLQLECYSRWKSVFNACITPSDTLKQSLQPHMDVPIQVIWNAVPTKAQRPSLKAPPTVAFADRLVREKGVDILIHAFKDVVGKIPEARLILAGAGPELENIKNQIRSADLESHVSVLGYVEPQELDHCLQSAWVQVMPSTWAEPFGQQKL